MFRSPAEGVRLPAGALASGALRDQGRSISPLDPLKIPLPLSESGVATPDNPRGWSYDGGWVTMELQNTDVRTSKPQGDFQGGPLPTLDGFKGEMGFLGDLRGEIPIPPDPLSARRTGAPLAGPAKIRIKNACPDASGHAK